MGETDVGDGESTENGSSGWNQDDVESEGDVDEALVLAGSFFVFLLVFAALNGLLTGGEEWFTNQVIAIALLPPLLYLLAMGRIASMEAFGVKVGMNPVPSRTVRSLEAPLPSREAGFEFDADQLFEVSPRATSGENAITFVVGEGEYDREYVDALLESVPDVEYFAYENADGTFEGLSSASLLYDREDFLDLVNDGSILRDPAVHTRPIYEDETEIDALRKFDRWNADVLPVLDDDHELVGVTTRGDVLTKMILEGVDGSA